MKGVFYFLLFTVSLLTNAQLIEYVSIQGSQGEFDTNDHIVQAQGKDQLFFLYGEENETAIVTLALSAQAIDFDINLVASSDFTIIDSLYRWGDSIQFKVRFKQLSQVELLRFTFRVTEADFQALEEVFLLPVFETYATIYPNSDELFIGEEKTFEVVTNNPENLLIDYRWKEGPSFNHRFSRNGQVVLLHLIPKQRGSLPFELPIALKKPRLDINDSLTFYTEPLSTNFQVKEGRLVFLQLDQPEITPEEDKRDPIIIQIDNHPRLRIGKTYRIEEQEQPGGPLIAELYTKTRLNNDKVLADLRVYAFHRKSDGYLYIKDGDQAQFVTNVDITPKTSINSIEIQREGKPWVVTNKVYPGEKLSVRLKGEGLHKSSISFQGISDLSYDSLVRNENLLLFELQVPNDVNTRSIEIFNYNQSTGQSLSVSEYKRPREFDFVSLDLAGEKFVVSEIDKPIYFEKNLTDLVVSFDKSMIDESEMYYGPQNLVINVKVTNKRGNLIEIYQFDDLKVCPGESSPRSKYYDTNNCKGDDINLNNFLTNKTHSLDEWSKIEIEIGHDRDVYGGDAFKRRIQVYLKRTYSFDVDLSFPAGLLILDANQSGDEERFLNFGGPSFAMMAQFSFYQEGKIAKYKPYKLGAGFIAIDAFNFSQNIGDGNTSSQNIGLVFMGSLHPTDPSKRFTFPLYAGFGYYILNDPRPFFLLGPGIRVRL